MTAALPRIVPIRPADDGLAWEERWQFRANCRGCDPDLFFPSRSEGWRGAPEAKEICRTCPVSTECLLYAMGDAKCADGVYGGTTANERRHIRWLLLGRMTLAPVKDVQPSTEREQDR